MPDKTMTGVGMNTMGSFFKATRPDGYDFRTGTVDYAGLCGTGQWLPELPDTINPECCSGDVYHASTVAAETLIGGQWPCRLFEVEGVIVARESHKRGFYTLRVVRELPAWQALGPNGQAVAALIERAATLTDDDMNAISLAYLAVPGSLREDAEDAALVAACHAQCDAARTAARRAAGITARNARQTATRTTAWNAADDRAWDAIRNAAIALVVRSHISPRHFSTLHGPWAAAMETADV